MRLKVLTPPWAGKQGRGRAQQGGRAQQAQTGGSGCVRGLEEGKHARHPLHSATHVAHGLQLRVRDLQQRAFVLLQPERQLLRREVVYPQSLPAFQSPESAQRRAEMIRVGQTARRQGPDNRLGQTRT